MTLSIIPPRTSLVEASAAEALAVTRQLLTCLCEELKLNCTVGQYENEAPQAVEAVRQAVRLLRESGFAAPEGATTILMEAVPTGRLQ